MRIFKGGNNMKISAHLQKTHQTLATHALAKAEHHLALAKIHSAMSNADGEKSEAYHSMHKAKVVEGTEEAHETLGNSFKKSSELHSDLASRHAQIGENHRELSEFHSSMAKACQKAMDSDLEKVVPDGIRGIIPNAPGVTMVPRAGQRVVEKSEVPLELEQIVGFDDLNS
jgi:hypothetical protein